MDRQRFNEIIDVVYDHYLNTHKDEIFILTEEMDLSKEAFIDRVKANYGFGFLFGIQITEEVTDNPTASKVITLKYKDEIIKITE